MRSKIATVLVPAPTSECPWPDRRRSHSKYLYPASEDQDWDCEGQGGAERCHDLEWYHDLELHRVVERHRDQCRVRDLLHEGDRHGVMIGSPGMTYRGTASLTGATVGSSAGT